MHAVVDTYGSMAAYVSVNGVKRVRALSVI
jgi:hypothetical protein